MQLNKALIRKRKRGFTLVELMIVVAIIGVLAALAIYGVTKYVTNAKTAEARNMLGAISKSAVMAWEGEQMTGTIMAGGDYRAGSHELCPSTTLTPATVPSGEKYQSASGDWSDWSCLKFHITGPQYYSYQYSSAAGGTGFGVSAFGDLDADGTLSTFELLGAIQGDAITIAPKPIETLPEE